jgi:hypothetical protein
MASILAKSLLKARDFLFIGFPHGEHPPNENSISFSQSPTDYDHTPVERPECKVPHFAVVLASVFVGHVASGKDVRGIFKINPARRQRPLPLARIEFELHRFSVVTDILAVKPNPAFSWRVASSAWAFPTLCYPDRPCGHRGAGASRSAGLSGRRIL